MKLQKLLLGSILLVTTSFVANGTGEAPQQVAEPTWEWSMHEAPMRQLYMRKLVRLATLYKRTPSPENARALYNQLKEADIRTRTYSGQHGFEVNQRNLPQLIETAKACGLRLPEGTDETCGAYYNLLTAFTNRLLREFTETRHAPTLPAYDRSSDNIDAQGLPPREPRTEEEKMGFERIASQYERRAKELAIDPYGVKGLREYDHVRVNRDALGESASLLRQAERYREIAGRPRPKDDEDAIEPLLRLQEGVSNDIVARDRLSAEVRKFRGSVGSEVRELNTFAESDALSGESAQKLKSFLERLERFRSLCNRVGQNPEIVDARADVPSATTDVALPPRRSIQRLDLRKLADFVKDCRSIESEISAMVLTADRVEESDGQERTIEKFNFLSHIDKVDEIMSKHARLM